MPRIGNTKKPPSEAPKTFTRAIAAAKDAAALADPSTYAEVGDFNRAQAVKTASESLEALKATVASTRDRTGRIRRAKLIAACLGLRWQGFTPKETAEILGVSHQAVGSALATARKDATIGDQIDRIEKIGVPLAVDNAIRGVMDGDKEYSLRVLDGRGIFRNHKSVEADIRVTKLEMSIKVEMPVGLENGRGEIRVGSIVGTSAIDGRPQAPVDPERPPAPLGIPAIGQTT
jgi:predicted transcriptional regulator